MVTSQAYEKIFSSKGLWIRQDNKVFIKKIFVMKRIASLNFFLLTTTLIMYIPFIIVISR
jgi:hypothetical protein